MIEQLKIFKENIIAFDVIDSFTEEDEKYFQKLFEAKIKEGFDQVNLLVKLDEVKISKINIKSFFEEIIWTLRNYKQMGHIAVVAHSKIVKALVPIDNFFFERASKGRLEKYFDVSQMDEAFDFVNNK